MKTRQTIETEQGYDSKEAVWREGVVDPFAVSVREEEGPGTKFVWWFLGHCEREGEPWGRTGEDLGREVVWVNVEEAVRVLSFKSDKEVVRKAHELYCENNKV